MFRLRPSPCALLLGLSCMGCAAPAEFGAAAIGPPPHSRFHPVPTHPVFAVQAPAVAPCLPPPADDFEVLPPPLVGPERSDGAPNLLPVEVARPLDEEIERRPSSRRR